MERFTKHGYELSVLQSGLQKSIRVGDVEQALRCALEINSILKIKLSVWNTLKTIAEEDVGMANPVVHVILIDLYKKSLKCDENALFCLTQAVVLLCKSKKSRAMSYAAVVACWKEGVAETVDYDCSDDLFENFCFPTSVPKDCEGDHLNQNVILKQFANAVMVAQCLQPIEPCRYENLIWLYNVTLRAFQLYEAEERVIIPQPTKNAFKCYEKQLNYASLFHRLLSDRVGVGRFHKSILSVLWQIVFKANCDDESQHKYRLDIIASLAEAAALGLGSKPLQLLIAVTLLRQYSSDIDYEMITERIKSYTWKLSDQLCSESLNAKNVEAYLSTRPIVIDDVWLDKHTYRGRGIDTEPLFYDWAKHTGYDISNWKAADYEGKCCRPKITQARGLQHFLSEGLRIENAADWFTSEFEADGKQLYLQHEKEHGMHCDAQHRAWLYKHRWLPQYKVIKRKATDDSTVTPPPAAKKAKRIQQKQRPEKQLCAQRRTALHKMHVYVTEKYVFKGPYKKNSERLDTTLARHILFRNIFNDRTVQAVAVVEWEGDGCYFRFPNVATKPHSEWKIIKTDSLNGKEQIKVVKRESMGIQLASDCLARLNDAQKVRILYHLLLRFCCAPTVGDSSLRNILYNGKAIYSIDLEETRINTEIKNVKTAEEVVQLLLSKKHCTDAVRVLAKTLRNNRCRFINALGCNEKIVSKTNIIAPLMRRTPHAKIDTVSMKQRFYRCATLLKNIE